MVAAIIATRKSTRSIRRKSVEVETRALALAATPIEALSSGGFARRVIRMSQMGKDIMIKELFRLLARP